MWSQNPTSPQPHTQEGDWSPAWDKTDQWPGLKVAPSPTEAAGAADRIQLRTLVMSKARNESADNWGSRSNSCLPDPNQRWKTHARHPWRTLCWARPMWQSTLWPDRQIDTNVRELMPPNPRLKDRETLLRHPTTETSSTRPEPTLPRRQDTGAKTEPQDSSNQTRDPNHIKVQITTKKQGPQPRRRITNPSRSNEGSSEKAVRHAPGRRTRNPTIARFSNSKLTGTPQMITEQEATATKETNDPFSISKAAKLISVQGPTDTSRDRSQDPDGRLNVTRIEQAASPATSALDDRAAATRVLETLSTRPTDWLQDCHVVYRRNKSGALLAVTVLSSM